MMKSVCILTAVIIIALGCTSAEIPNEQEERLIEDLGATVVTNALTGKVSEIRINGSRTLRDPDLAILNSYKLLTDLSLEGTSINGSGFAALTKLSKIEWLNLWDTKITDLGLTEIARLKSLNLLFS